MSASVSGRFLTVTATIGGECTLNPKSTNDHSQADVHMGTIGLFSFSCPTGSCTQTRTFDRSCLPTGTHTVFLDVVCGLGTPDNCLRLQRGFATTTFDYDSTPKVSVSGGGKNAQGNLEFAIDFDFTNGDGQRRLILDIPGMIGGSYTPSREKGTDLFILDPNCRPSGNYQLNVEATVCDGSPTHRASDSQPFTISGKTSVEIIDVVRAPDDTIRAHVAYDFPNTPGALDRTIELFYVGNDAIGLGTHRPLDQKGVWISDPLACPPKEGALIRAFGTSCNGDRVESKPAKIPMCDGVCKIPPPGETKCPCVGKPVHLSSSAMEYSDSDPLPGTVVLPLSRTYHSTHDTVTSLFGRGWTTFLDARATALRGANNRHTVVLRMEDESRYVFDEIGGTYVQSYPAADTRAGQLVFDGAAGVFRHRAGGSTLIREFRASDGRLVSIGTAGGDRVTINYDASSRPADFVDSRGRWSWMVSYDSGGRISALQHAQDASLRWTYSYVNGNLTTVTAPGGAVWRTYVYGAGGLETALDGDGRRIESHQYIPGTNGVTDSLAPDERITSIINNQPGRVHGERTSRVTTADGKTTTYFRRYIAGNERTVEIEGSCSCGGEDAVFGHDADGNVIREQHERGFVTLRAFNGGRVASVATHYRPADCDPETDSSGCRLTPDDLLAATLVPTPHTTTTSYTYGDANWPDLATRMTVESVREGATREEIFAYDPATGKTLTHSIIGHDPTSTTDSSITRTTHTTLYALGVTGDFDPCAGATDCAFQQAWLSLPQPEGYVRSVNGPRVDVDDSSGSVYYPFDAAVPADARGRLAAVRNAAGHITRFEDYDAFGNARRIIDPNGVVTRTTHDHLGRLLTSTLERVPGCDTAADPLCSTDIVTRRMYRSGAGELAIEIGPRGEATTFEYDEWGRTTAILRGSVAAPIPSTAAAAIAAGSWREKMTYEFSPVTGRKVAERMFSWSGTAWTLRKETTFTYDTNGFLRTVAEGTGTIVHAYEHGDLASTQDENHTAPNAFYKYDGASRLTEVRQTLDSGFVTTSYEYDRHGNLIRVTDPNGNQTSYVYDDFGQMVRQTSPVTGTTTYSYDDAGNLLGTTDANGATTTRTYDALGRVATATSTHGSASESVFWTYDDPTAFGRGRLASMSDPTGSTTYRYDRRGLLLNESKSVRGIAYTTSFEYDASGNRIRLVDPAGQDSTFGFDFANRPLSASTNGQPLVISASYLPFGPRLETQFGNGTVQRWTYDSRYRPFSHQLLREGAPILSHQYGHDGVGNITSIHDLLDSSWNRDFRYDDLNRLTGADTGSSLWGNGSFVYDAMGNLKSSSLGNRSSTFQHEGSTPKLSTVNENGVTRAVTYDAVGNEQVVGAETFVYSPRNHLVSSEERTYEYDGRGIRTIRSRPLALPTIASFVIEPDHVAGGETATATVTVTAPAPAGGLIIDLVSSNDAVTAPAFVSVAEGSLSGNAILTTTPVADDVNATLTASLEASTQTATLTVRAPRLDALTLTATRVTGGTPVTGTVTLDAIAPTGGLTIALQSDVAAVSVPATVHIEEGAATADFAIVTSAVASEVTATITASRGGISRHASLTIAPPGLAQLQFTPPALRGGSSTTGTLSLGGPAPEGGATVALSSNAIELTVPANVHIPAGLTSAAFTASASPVESSLDVLVTSTYLGTSQTGMVTITPPALVDFHVTPAILIGGEAAIAAVILDAPAASGGAAVTITSSDPAIIPSTVVSVPAGVTSGQFPLPTNEVAVTTSVVVSATRHGVTLSSTVVVEPPPVTLATLTITPASLVGSNSAIGTVTLTNPAPATGLVIDLTSSDPALASVPSMVLVPAGATQATFTISTTLVATPVSVTISAAHGAVLRTTTLTLQPPAGNYVSSLAVTPQFIVGGSTATGTVTLASPSTSNSGSAVLITSSDPALIVPSSVTVRKNRTNETFTISTSAVTTPRNVVITASFGGVVQRVTAIVAPENTVTLVSLIVTPQRVVGGNAVTGTVTLSEPAPFGGASVTLVATRRNMITVPQSVTITEGATSATFLIGTDAVNGNRDRAVDIDAAYNGVTRTATLTLAPEGAVTNRASAIQCASLSPVLCASTVTPTSTPTSRVEGYFFYTPELNLLAESQESLLDSKPIRYSYVWFAGQPLAQIDHTTGQLAYYANDHLGTPLVQLDAVGATLWHGEREPYGNTTVHRTGAARHQPLAFPGQEEQRDEEQSYNIHRWYRPSFARYTQADPVGLAGGNHLFAYVNANPVLNVDHYGLATVTIRNPIYPTIDRPIWKECNAYSCTRFVGATLSCTCRCNASGKASMSLSATVQPIMYLPNPRYDKVTKPFERRGHEEQHIADLKGYLERYLSAWEAVQYDTKGKCDSVCKSLTRAFVDEILSDAVEQSQCALDGICK